MDNQNKYEDKIDTFFDNLDKKKERSEKVRRIIKFVMRLIFPFFLLPFMMLFGVVVSLMLPRNNIGGIGVSIALIFLLFFPLYSIIYGMFVARGEKRNSFFAIYNSIASTMQFCILDGFDLHAIKYYIGIFFTTLFWTLIPMWIHNLKTNRLSKNEGNGKSINSNENNL